MTVWSLFVSGISLRYPAVTLEVKQLRVEQKEAEQEGCTWGGNPTVRVRRALHASQLLSDSCGE